MTDKQLKKMKRVELLELLVEQADELDALCLQLAQAQENLEQRELTIQQAGSIAQAALQINNVFAAADKAAQDYLDNVQTLQKQQQSAIEDAEEKAAALLVSTRERCQRLEGETWTWCRQQRIAAGAIAENLPEDVLEDAVP